MSNAPLRVRVHAVKASTPRVKVFDLRSPGGERLPPFTAGAHIDVHPRPDMVRQYSLLGDPADTDHYLIAVAREDPGRGGSSHLHDRVLAGDELLIGAPRNHFALREDAGGHVLLIAGGIGVTPILSMIRRLRALGRPWSLHYGARDRRHAPLLDEIETLADKDAVSFYFSREPGGARMDVGAVVRDAPEGSHIYGCGPSAMLDALAAACAHLPADRLHREHFAGAPPVAGAGGFTVELARSGRTLEVGPGQTILEALSQAGIRASYSCREGVCGECETRVLSGVPDHRDMVLTDAERAAGRTMMICCSGALSDRLALDL
jgi:ferredoxin-NADP reductase